MRTTSKVLGHGVLACIFLLWASAGCGAAESDERDIGQLVFEDPVEAPGPAPHDELARASWLSLSADGELAWWDASTGAVLATAAPGDGLPGAVQDLAFDEVGVRAILVRDQGEAEGASAAVVARSMRLLRPSFANALRLGRTRPHAQLTAVPAGTVLFEGGTRPRWRLLPRDGAPVSSLAQAPPLALWAQHDSTQLDAVVRTQHRGASFEHWLAVDTAGTDFELLRATPLRQSLPLPGGPVQVVPHRAGVLVARLLAGRIVLSLVRGDGQERVTHQLAAPARRLAQVIRMATNRPGHERYALLFAEPTRLWVMDLSEPGQRASLALDGELQLRGDGFGRHLVARGSRLWIATSAGVVATEVVDGPAGLELRQDDRFRGEQLRGPLAGPVLRSSVSDG